MASIPNYQKKDIGGSVSSVSNIKTKKSSNLLSAFVRRSKKKSKKSETTLNPIDISSQNLEYIASNSSIGLHTEEYDAGMDSIKSSVDNGDCIPVILKSVDENLHMTDSEVIYYTFKPYSNLLTRMF